MNKAIDINEEEEERAPKLFVPRVITGGKGPPDDPGDPNNPDWLSKIPIHTTLLAQYKKNQEFPLVQVVVLFRTTSGRSTLIHMQGNKDPVWAEPYRFCKDFRFHEIIQTAEEYELELKANEQIRREFNLPQQEEQELDPEDIGL